MRTATESLAVDNLALWDTFTGYPQDKRTIPHRLSAHWAHKPRFYVTLWGAAPCRFAPEPSRPITKWFQYLHPIVLSSRDGSCTELYADTPM